MLVQFEKFWERGSEQKDFEMLFNKQLLWLFWLDKEAICSALVIFQILQTLCSKNPTNTVMLMLELLYIKLDFEILFTRLLQMLSEY